MALVLRATWVIVTITVVGHETLSFGVWKGAEETTCVPSGLVLVNLMNPPQRPRPLLVEADIR